MHDYFGITQDNSSIVLKSGEAIRSWTKINGRWHKTQKGALKIKGFYEGSIIFGNRFRNTSYQLLRSLDRVDNRSLDSAPEFIRQKLGFILHNNENFYEKLFILDSSRTRQFEFRGELFYYEKNARRISQFHMSTGENLLITILNSIFRRNNDRETLNQPCVIFLDEIELALHPSSLKRLLFFLKQMSDQYSYAIYFSTHSLELISGIAPDNIFFLERHSDESIEVLNPCYPAYATRTLYDHSGYDYIIMVEDDLARLIVKKLLRAHALLSNKLVHVLPCGGFSNVIMLAHEVIASNLIGNPANIIIILDGDSEAQALNFMQNNGIENNIPLNFLPIESFEKFLRKHLFEAVDHALFRHLNDYIFHKISLTQVIDGYRSAGHSEKDYTGKKLYRLIDTELRNRNMTRGELVEVVVDYLIAKNGTDIRNVTAFLKKQLASV